MWYEILNKNKDIQKIKQQLQSIIDNNGSCSSSLDCTDCPFTIVARSPEINLGHCVALVSSILNQDDQVVNSDWAKVAILMLVEIEIEEMLAGD